jgi:hypothetical protein
MKISILSSMVRKFLKRRKTKIVKIKADINGLKPEKEN